MSTTDEGPDRPAADEALSRRSLLRRGLFASGALLVPSALAACTTDKADPSDATTGPDSVAGSAMSAVSASAAPDSSQPAAVVASPLHYAFDGTRQAGIVTSAPEAAIFASLDSIAADRPALVRAFSELTNTARALTNAEVFPAQNNLLPPADNLILDPADTADGLTITMSVGSSLFDERYGLASLKPLQLIRMPAFPNDKPKPEYLHGDVMVEIAGRSVDAVNRALRLLLRATRKELVLRWMMPGFLRPNTAGPGRSSTRNLLGFKDGTANPDAGDAALMDELLWVRPSDGEPAWAANGTYHVNRLIRNRVEFWDRTPLRTQETIIGRVKGSGAPLGGTDETDVPDFAADPSGDKFRLDGHIRLANPRTAATEKNRILRRGFNYSLGFDASGQLNQGLLFNSFQRDLASGFVAVQTRLNGEALEEYITPFGGGYFFALPGTGGPDGYLGQTLLES